MKKIKYYIIAILCVFCLCLTFSGCTTNASYVEDSFTIKSMHYDTYYNELYVSFEFKIAVPKTGRYRVDYVIYQGYSENTIIAEGNEYNTLTVNEGEHSISSYIYLKTTNNAEIANIKDVTITLTGDESGYDAYAIGFGVAGAVVLAGLIALFVCDKKGLLKKKDK